MMEDLFRNWLLEEYPNCSVGTVKQSNLRKGVICLIYVFIKSYTVVVLLKKSGMIALRCLEQTNDYTELHLDDNNLFSNIKAYIDSTLGENHV